MAPKHVRALQRRFLCPEVKPGLVARTEAWLPPPGWRRAETQTHPDRRRAGHPDRATGLPRGAGGGGGACSLPSSLPAAQRAPRPWAQLSSWWVVFMRPQGRFVMEKVPGSFPVTVLGFLGWGRRDLVTVYHGYLPWNVAPLPLGRRTPGRPRAEHAVMVFSTSDWPSLGR